MKNYRDSFDYPQTYEAAIAVARQLPFDPSYRDGQYTMGVFWGVSKIYGAFLIMRLQVPFIHNGLIKGIEIFCW